MNKEAKGWLKKVSSKATRKMSCDKTWMRIAIQCFFGTITVSSFILILLMAMRGPSKNNEGRPRRCDDQNFILCTQLSYEQCEFELLQALWLNDCDQKSLSLVNSNFPNNTLPSAWLSEVNVDVTKFSLYNGNLRYIAPYAFATRFGRNIKILELYHVSLTLQTDTFNGLLNLQELRVVNSVITIDDILCLAPLTENLFTLVITRSGEWNPRDLTGSLQFKSLIKVDFSHNNFGTLKKRSFFGISECRKLNLADSNIYSIEDGTFDNLSKILYINLEKNKLKYLSEDAFDYLISFTKVVIELRSNPWSCDCDLEHMLMLQHSKRIISNALKCFYPLELRGKLFTSFKSFCPIIEIDSERQIYFLPANISVNQVKSDDGNSLTWNRKKMVCNSLQRFVIRSPLPGHECSREETSKIKHENLGNLARIIKSTFSRILHPELFVSDGNSSVLEMTGKTTTEYSLIWFENDCPNDISCINFLPKTIRIYNVDSMARYTLCPINPPTGIIVDGCVSYSLQGNVDSEMYRYRHAIYAIAVLVGCSLGATLLYGVIRKNPTLLRGSKRVLLVKHKIADALILPPKVALRKSDSQKSSVLDDAEDKLGQLPVWMVPNTKIFRPQILSKNNSMRSSKSNAPSYISALQPTEEQMKEWRLQTHFGSKILVNSNRSSLSPSPISFAYDGDFICSVNLEKNVSGSRNTNETL